MFRTMNVRILSRVTVSRQDFVRSRERETSNLWQQRYDLLSRIITSDYSVEMIGNYDSVVDSWSGEFEKFTI